MKSFPLILFLGVTFIVTSISSCSSSKNPSQAANEQVDEDQANLRVMAYNIHHANPPSKPDFIDIGAIVNTIRAQDPDLVALQEIDADTERSGEGNQAEIIAEKLGMHVFFGKAIDYEGGAYGVAVLSKFPISDGVVHRLPTKPDTNGEPRILATAKVHLPNGAALRFGSTHLDAQRESTNRLLQIKEIVEIASNEGLPLIIAGDFNATPESKVIHILDESFTRTCSNCAPTIPVKNPAKAIDFIAFKPENKFKVTNHKVISETYASDHLPIMAVLNILP